ncbi:acetyl-CoA carboxylase biotin carboxylase subunit [Sutcliffiella sp. NC1]|uniref:acetyl-CoA carboxylase biotin carboxylase subunit n=1 Tax=Sutcliffiella sp. NC1 TaxID=3004096 RepID=UPI0022DD46A1|nr:acetyl-CoA carboxylase biotin carboxylase subunit [Sutcliffiella sp. NC1]WBL13389.1 acetyl-CoA carboxylase biotin carboxylase subunit [Sutcliffiella sp. NC1]
MQKILIANRGEIAERVIRTCRNLGIETVAVFSEADKDMPYVTLATSAHHIGGAHPQQSYLNMEQIIKVAREEKVDGIHPGYGFLSENSAFAREVRENGFIFIGPSSDVIRLMGDKLQSRLEMIKANVPVIPGSDKPLTSVEEAYSLAETIGFPVMLKASGGGGGIGMHKCENSEDIRLQFEETKKRAKAYFNNDDLFIEKYIGNARHIEVQIVGDSYGNVLHLHERNCSVQRRNQKVIEEATSPHLPEEVRSKLYEAAVNAAKQVNYYNAGTVEFIMDENNNFYFLEMNTRLQVEHAISEEITGIDLVEWQILIANGEKIPLSQNDINVNGHSIEYRVYAEDPVKFFPSPGQIVDWNFPVEENVRIDSGYGSNLKVTPFYDPLIAKIIVTASSREACIEKSLNYLEKVSITGINTNIPFLIASLSEESFKDGKYSTNFVSNLMNINK